MATAGESIENPLTGERVVFRETAAQTGGELFAFDLYARPAGRVAAAHVHPSQEERFTVRAGTIGMVVGGEERVATAGEQIVVAAGVAHDWWNAGAAEAQVLVEFRPALDTETFFETFFGLARDGKTNRRGMPNLLRMLVLVDELGPSCPVLPRLPIGLQYAFARLLAPIGRLVGYRAIYARYTPGEASAARSDPDGRVARG